jgi:general secretion pathway protein G
MTRRPAFSLIELLIVIMVLGILASIALQSFGEAAERARVARASAEIRGIERVIVAHQIVHGPLPRTLGEAGIGNMVDPWGNAYVYLVLDGPASTGAARKDRFLVPLNSDYDLYSKGRDGLSMAPLTARTSRDDVIRAADGAYVGPVTGF